MRSKTRAFDVVSHALSRVGAGLDMAIIESIPRVDRKQKKILFCDVKKQPKGTVVQNFLLLNYPIVPPKASIEFQKACSLQSNFPVIFGVSDSPCSQRVKDVQISQENTRLAFCSMVIENCATFYSN